METSGYSAMPIYTGQRDDVYMEEGNSMQQEEDLDVLTGVKQKQNHKWKPIQHSLC